MATSLPPAKGQVPHFALIIWVNSTEDYHLFTGDGNSWRLSTAIRKAEWQEDTLYVETKSGSSYTVYPNRWGATVYMRSILSDGAERGFDHKIVAEDEKAALMIVDKINDQL